MFLINISTFYRVVLTHSHNLDFFLENRFSKSQIWSHNFCRIISFTFFTLSHHLYIFLKITTLNFDYSQNQVLSKLKLTTFYFRILTFIYCDVFLKISTYYDFDTLIIVYFYFFCENPKFWLTILYFLLNCWFNLILTVSYNLDIFLKITTFHLRILTILKNKFHLLIVTFSQNYSFFIKSLF